MPVNLRRKGTRGGLISQIHRDDNVPVQKNGSKIARSGKRSSSGSPQQQAPSSKRAAFGDITNAYRNVTNGTTKGKGKSSSNILKPLKKTTKIPIAKREPPKEEEQKVVDAVSLAELQSSSGVSTSSGVSSAEVVSSGGGSSSSDSSQEYAKPTGVDDILMLSPANVPLPDSSPEDISMQDDRVQQRNLKNLRDDMRITPTVVEQRIASIELNSAKTTVTALPVKPDIDIDEENKDDPNQSPEYAFEIFKYLRNREDLFRVTPYFEKQRGLTTHMRAILMDWLVEVQENFELNHETLYLAVKLVDLYLTKTVITKDTLQLLGAAAMFISCKFDERCPPALEDFIFICDDAYDRRQFIQMERDVLRCIDYDLGMPLSYRFLRRYAKCVHASMETLTLGRFILEMTLMESEFIYTSESKIAAAALLLSFKMKDSGKWDSTLVHFSGYRQEELTELVARLNAMLQRPAHKQINTVRTKYSHQVFYEVAKILPLTELS